MRNMALIIRKDFITGISAYGSSAITFIIFFAMVAINTSFIPMAMNMCIYMLVVSLFQSEENDLVCNVRAILPVRQSELVVARYVYLYLLVAGSAVLIALISLIAGAFGLHNQWVPPLVLGISLTLFMASLMVPLMYRYGVVKMRVIILILYAAVIASSFAVTAVVAEIRVPQNTAMIYAICILGAFLLSLLSLAVSLKIKK